MTMAKWRVSYLEEEETTARQEAMHAVVKRLLIGTSPDADIRVEMPSRTRGKVIQGVDPFHAEVRLWSGGEASLVDLGTATTCWRLPEQHRQEQLHWVPAGGWVTIPTYAVISLGYTNLAHGVVEVEGWAQALDRRTRRKADGRWEMLHG